MADYGPLYQGAGNQYVIDPLLLQALAGKESDQDPNAVGPVIQSGPAKGQQAGGFMQFLPGTAAEQGVNVNDVTSSVYGAARYLDNLMNQHNQSLPQALATYGGTTPDSPYVSDVLGRYRALKAAWAATGSQTAPPPTDTDPSSPTYGQPTGKNFTAPARAPEVGTTAKGNPGQPDISVPTTGAAVTVTAPPSFAPPEQGGPKGQRKPAAVKPGSVLSQAQPHDDSAAPAAPATPPGPLSQAQPLVNDDGSPIETGTPAPPAPNQQYLTSATSPGAKAVGASPTGTTFAEGRVPGPAFQAAINLATDPDQKARIAADQLGVSLDRIIVGPGGRMAAVDDQGQPYFIQPAPVFSSDAGTTKPQVETGTGVAGGPMRGSVVAMSGTPGASVRVTEPGQWQPTSSFASSPYGRLFREPENISPSNIAAAAGAGAPGAVTNALTYAPGAISNPATGSLLVGGASMLTDAGRQWLANRLDPNATARPNPWSAVDPTKAATNALLNFGGRLVFAVPHEPLGPPQRLGTQPGAQLTQFPTAPGIPGFRGPNPEPMPVGPNVPIAARPATPGEVIADPFEGAGAATGPYAPSTPPEMAAQPTRLPPPRFPIMSQQGVEARADEIIQHFAQGGNTTPDERQLITQAGLPQTTGNGGLAALWRYMATSTPEGINLIQGFKDRALAARQAFVTRLVGTQEDLDALRAQRQANTQQAYNNAFGGQTTPVNPQAQVDQIDSILQSPQGVRSDIAQPLRQIRDMFYERDPVTGQLPTDADGNPVRTLITDPERLYQVRRDINDSLRGPAANSTLPNARAAANVMGDVLNGLDETIASGAPNYPQYMQQYADQSRAINAMEFLQGRNLTDAAGNTTLAKVDSAVKAAEQQRGIDPRRRPADALTDDQMSQLYMLRDDLRRQANETKGKALGSDTAQNFATSSVANNLLAPAARAGARAIALKVAESTGVPFLEYPAMMAENWIENRLTGGEGRAAAVRQAVIRRLMNEDNSGTRALSGVPSIGQGGSP